MKKILASGLMTLMTTLSNVQAQQTNSPSLDSSNCGSVYAVFFLNGIRTTIERAHENAQIVREMLGNNYNGTPLTVYTSYNPTETRYNPFAYDQGDLAEVYAQKEAEGKELYEDGVVTHHAATYATSLLAGNHVMVVSHSQGNLYANAIYGYLRENFGNNLNFAAFGIAAVATPANFVATGDGYVTSSTDLVIDMVRRRYPVLPSNDSTVGESPASDRFGHGFSEIYTNSDYLIRNHTKRVMTDTLARLSSTLTTQAAGPITATLTWSSPGDIDLHTYEPVLTNFGEKSHVYYANRQGFIGYLDRDDIVGTGPEHYYAACENFIPGQYEFGINYYSGSGAKKVDMKISALGVDYPTVSTTVVIPQGPSGNSRPLMMREVTILERQDNGVYRAVVSTNIE